MSEDYGELPLEDFTHQLLWNIKALNLGIWLLVLLTAIDIVT